LCSLKFRRQHSIGPFIVDFACLSEQLVVEIDGGYHDQVQEADLKREAFLQKAGWQVLRFTAEDVERDAEAVAIVIAQYLGLAYEFRKRKHTGSGMKNVNSKKNKPQ